MRESKDIVSRVIVGTTLIVAGVLIHCAFTFILPKPRDYFELFKYVVVIITYSILANLFILLGLKYYFGPGNWFNKHVSASLKQLLLVSIATAVALGLILLILAICWVSF